MRTEICAFPGVDGHYRYLRADSVSLVIGVPEVYRSRQPLLEPVTSVQA